MKFLFHTFRDVQSNGQSQLRVIAMLVGLFFFNFSVLNSANCKTFCHTTLKEALENSSEIIITAEMAKNFRVDPHYFCKLHLLANQEADSSRSADTESPHDCDFCYYCLMMLGGMAVAFIFPTPAPHIQPQGNTKFRPSQSIPVQAITYPKPSRAPPIS